MNLLIDTTEHNIVRLELWQEKMIDRINKGVNRNLSERLIFVIENLLKKNHIKLAKLSGIAVRVGEGSFTGIRTGVATANALGFAHKIPVKSVEEREDLSKLKFPKKWSLKTQAIPKYGRPPNITKPKK